MKYIKSCVFLAVILSMSSCSFNSDEVNSDKTYNSGDSNKYDAYKVDVSSVNVESENIYSYLTEKGYDQKFVLSEDINVNKIDKLYNIKLKQCHDYEKNFPSIYEKLFDKNFISESGYESIEQLPKLEEDSNEQYTFFFNNASVVEGVSYIDYGSASSELEYTTSLFVGKSGFIYYENDYDLLNEYGYKNIYNCSKTIPENDYFDLVNGESYSVNSAFEFADNYISEILHFMDSDFEYHPSYIDIKATDDNKNVFEIDFQKYYEGIPFTDGIIGFYDDGSKRTKPMYYCAAMYSPDRLTKLSVPYGLEEIVSSDEIVEPIISLESAFDILNSELAPNIKLEISDIKMMYYNEYDASDVEEAMLLYEKDEEMTKEQDLAAGFPELVGGREYTCYPVWAFTIENEPLKNDSGNYSNACSNDYIYLNVQTGEIINYLERGSLR